MLFSVLTMFNYDESLFANLSFPSGINKDTAINTILEKCAELEVLYINPDTLKALIGYWSKARQWSWGRYALLLQVDYDPIENYSRVEEYNSKLTATGNSIAKNAVYNQDEMVDSSAGQTSGENVGTNTGYIHGNIGVTTSQHMLNSELVIDEKMNIYDFIAEDFKKRFCIMVY